MLEKSATAAQTAPSRSAVKSGTIESLSHRFERLYGAISHRAYELFERDGRVNGNDLANWLDAENELLVPVHIDMEETDAEFIVRAEVPGFTANDLEVNVEPRRLTISGKRESKEEAGDSYSQENSQEIFRAIELPAEVNTTKVSAALKDGLLDILIPKAETRKAMAGQPLSN